jgi:hypothetical protein
MIVWIVLLRMLSRLPGLGSLWVLLIRYLGCIVVSSRIFCNAIVKGVLFYHSIVCMMHRFGFLGDVLGLVMVWAYITYLSS